MTKFFVFHRTWWKRNRNWPNGLEPSAGRKHAIGFATTEAAAQDMCRVWSANNAPGKLSRKAEFQSV